MSERLIDISVWGKDHWSLLAYLEIRAVDYSGTIDRKHMRTNPETHPHLIWIKGYWESKYSTRLKKGFIGGHDDWDCMDDLEKAGFLENKGTGFHRVVAFTRNGLRLAYKLREHKASGGNFGDFNPDAVSEKICDGVELRRLRVLGQEE